MMSMNQYEIDYQQGYDACNDKWIDKLEQIRAEIEELNPTINHGFEGFYNCQNEVLKIIAKALKEQNEL